MRIHRVYGAVLHLFYISKGSPDRITDVFFWPSIDIIVWGLTSVYFIKTSSVPNILTIILSGIILWTVVYSAQREISFGLLEELWNRNLINLFTTPITFSEWILSILIVALAKTIASFLVASMLALLLYKMNIFIYGFYLLPFILLLIMTAWSVGFLITGMVLRYSSKIQTLAWSMIALISPFSAVYYSVSTLPVWAQKIALIVPTSYIFEGMRQIIIKGTFNPSSLIMALVINCIYLILSLIYLKMSFNKVLEKGLAKVY